LFFGGAAFASRMSAKMWMSNCHLRLQWCTRRAAEKQKE
jgi:hypothetical protein